MNARNGKLRCRISEYFLVFVIALYRLECVVEFVSRMSLTSNEQINRLHQLHFVVMAEPRPVSLFIRPNQNALGLLPPGGAAGHSRSWTSWRLNSLPSLLPRLPLLSLLFRRLSFPHCRRQSSVPLLATSRHSWRTRQRSVLVFWYELPLW